MHRCSRRSFRHLGFAASWLGEPGVCRARTHAGAWFAIDDTHTHEECSLSQDVLDDHPAQYPCHGSRFDLIAGDGLNPPAGLPVRTHRADG